MVLKMFYLRMNPVFSFNVTEGFVVGRRGNLQNTSQGECIHVVGAEHLFYNLL